MKQPSIEITERQQGPNGWAAALLAGAIAGSMVILAVAVWQISVGLSVAVAAAGIGIGIERVCYGVSMVVYQARRGQAERQALEEGGWNHRQLR